MTASSSTPTSSTPTPRPCASAGPFGPALSRNPLELADEAKAAGKSSAEYVVEELKEGRPGLPARIRTIRQLPAVLNPGGPTCSDPSSKGHEYFLKHLLGTDHAVQTPECEPDRRPEDVKWRDEAPRQSSTCSRRSTSA